MKTSHSVCVALAFLGLPLAALHAEGGTEALTLRPWSGATLVATEDDARMALGLSFLHGGFRLDFEGSAPLDQSSNATGALAKGFAGKLFVAYDSRWSDLGLPDDGIAVEPTLEACERYGLAWSSTGACDRTPCTGGNLARARAKEQKVQTFKDAYHLEPLNAWAVGLTVGGSYDRLSAFADTTTLTRTGYDDYDLEAGLRATWAVAQPLLLVLDGGWKGAHDVAIADQSACQPGPDGQDVCETGSVLVSDGSLLHRGYARLAANWIIPTSFNDVVPGFETRFGFEDLGGDARVDTRFLFYFAPIKSPLSVSFGVGFVLSTALEGSGGHDVGDTLAFTPFAVTSGTFGSLASGD